MKFNKLHKPFLLSIFLLILLHFTPYLVHANSFKKIKIGNTILKVEIADSDSSQRKGLMFRQKIDENYGMLFIYSKEEILRFWMKNTFIPLSIGFFNKDKKLIDIQDMEPVSSVMVSQPKTYESAEPAQFALEVNQGWFQRYKIQKGDSFTWVN